MMKIINFVLLISISVAYTQVVGGNNLPPSYSSVPPCILCDAFNDYILSYEKDGKRWLPPPTTHGSASKSKPQGMSSSCYKKFRELAQHKVEVKRLFAKVTGVKVYSAIGFEDVLAQFYLLETMPAFTGGELFNLKVIIRSCLEDGVDVKKEKRKDLKEIRKVFRKIDRKRERLVRKCGVTAVTSEELELLSILKEVVKNE